MDSGRVKGAGQLIEVKAIVKKSPQLGPRLLVAQ